MDKNWLAELLRREKAFKGGAGSGFFGHEGRPGEEGGSTSQHSGDMLSKFKPGIQTALSSFPKKLIAGLKIEYDPRNRRKSYYSNKTIFITAADDPKEITGTIQHEVGHHIFDGLSSMQQSQWSKISDAYGTSIDTWTLRNYDQYFSDVPGVLSARRIQEETFAEAVRLKAQNSKQYNTAAPQIRNFIDRIWK